MSDILSEILCCIVMHQNPEHEEEAIVILSQNFVVNGRGMSHLLSHGKQQQPLYTGQPALAGTSS